MCILHRGVVTAYDADTRSGMIRLDNTGEVLPFSFTDGRCFTQLSGRIDWLEARTMREPAKRDRVVVEIGCRGNERVVRWGCAAAYGVIERRLRARPLAA